MTKLKRIGVLTSGGDCGGLNAVIRAIFLRAKNKYNIEVYGIRNGTLGLINRPLDFEKLTYKSFQGFLIKQGGTFLGTNSKGDPFKFFKDENEINLFFDKKSLNLKGWQTVDLYQNLNIVYLSSIRINQKIEEKKFILPNSELEN